MKGTTGMVTKVVGPNPSCLEIVNVWLYQSESKREYIFDIPSCTKMVKAFL